MADQKKPIYVVWFVCDELDHLERFDSQEVADLAKYYASWVGSHFGSSVYGLSFIDGEDGITRLEDVGWSFDADGNLLDDGDEYWKEHATKAFKLYWHQVGGASDSEAAK